MSIGVSSELPSTFSHKRQLPFCQRIFEFWWVNQSISRIMLYLMMSVIRNSFWVWIIFFLLSVNWKITVWTSCVHNSWLLRVFTSETVDCVRLDSLNFLTQNCEMKLSVTPEFMSAVHIFQSLSVWIFTIVVMCSESLLFLIQLSSTEMMSTGSVFLRTVDHLSSCDNHVSYVSASDNSSM